MKLPFNKVAIIDRKKTACYLLDYTHPVGGSKAKYFGRIGFSISNVGLFEKELYKIVQNNEITGKRPSGDNSGICYAIIGKIEAPNGKRYKIRTVWYISNGSQIPSLVTADPV
jgi:hypothetical protein